MRKRKYFQPETVRKQPQLFPGKCPSGKVRYPTKGYAKAVLKEMRAAGNVTGRGRMQDFYECSRCGGFHLTTLKQPKNAVASQQARGIL